MNTHHFETVSYFVLFHEREENQKEHVVQNLEQNLGKNIPSFNENVEFSFTEANHFGKGYSLKITAPEIYENLLHEHFLTNSKAAAMIKIE